MQKTYLEVYFWKKKPKKTLWCCNR